VLAVLDTSQDFLLCRRVAGQLVGNDHPWHILQAYAQFAEELFGGVFVAPALDQDIKHVAMLINGSPQIVGLPVDA